MSLIKCVTHKVCHSQSMSLIHQAFVQGLGRLVVRWGNCTGAGEASGEVSNCTGAGKVGGEV